MKKTPRLLAVAVSVIALSGPMTGCGTKSGSLSKAAESPPSAAKSAIGVGHGIQLGMYYGDQSLTATNKALGATPAIHLTYFDWKSNWSADPTLSADARRGQTSLVNWEPFGVKFHDIVAGKYDALIKKQAKGAASLSRPVLLDFAAEMNEEEGWGGHDPELYIAAWRHMHAIFAKNAGGKVQWVWAPNNTNGDGTPAAIKYYPGSDYVDWTGIDGYNWGTSDPGFEWQSFSSVFNEMYKVLHRLGKPIIIGEMSSDEVGGNKASWIRGIMPTLNSRFPDIKALVWFDIEKERDWRIHSSTSAFTAFKNLANDPHTIPARTRPAVGTN